MCGYTDVFPGFGRTMKNETEILWNLQLNIWLRAIF